MPRGGLPSQVLWHAVSCPAPPPDSGTPWAGQGVSGEVPVRPRWPALLNAEQRATGGGVPGTPAGDWGGGAEAGVRVGASEGPGWEGLG